MRGAWIRTSVGVLGLAAASCAIFFALRPPLLAESIVYGSGHIEGTEVRIAAEANGRVVEQALEEGLRVSAGQKGW